MYIKITAQDTLSPNRWYNLPGESHLDTTNYTIKVYGEYSKFFERLNITL